MSRSSAPDPSPPASPNGAGTVRTCAHCGTSFVARSPGDTFCGPACAAVHYQLRAAGLERFYSLRRGAVPPVSPGALAPPPADPELSARLAAAEAEAPAGGLARARLGLRGLACTGCVWVVGAIAGRTPGISRAVADPVTGALDLAWQPGVADPADFLAALHRFGYTASSHPGEGHASSGGDLSSRLGIAAFLAMNGMLFSFPIYFGMPPDQPPAPLFRGLAWLFATAALIVGLSFFGRRAWLALRAGSVAFDLPVALGLILAYAGSVTGWLLGDDRLLYFDFVASFTFLMLVGRWLHDLIVERHRRGLGLAAGPPPIELVPDAAGDTVTGLGPASSSASTRASVLRAGQRYRIAPGHPVPVASRPVDASAPVSLSLASLNGEPEPHLWPASRDLPAGAILLGREPVLLCALEDWNHSLYRHLLEDPGRPLPPPLSERLLRIWLATVLLAASATGLVWWLRLSQPGAGLQAVISLLVLSCPCALGLAWPLADALAGARLRALGVYVRSPDLWGRLRRVRAVAFDKTGTLTTEVPTLANPTALDQLDAPSLAALRRLVADSLHPLGRSLREALAARGPGPLAAGTLTETPGRGTTLVAPDGTLWRLGSHPWATGDNTTAPAAGSASGVDSSAHMNDKPRPASPVSPAGPAFTLEPESARVVLARGGEVAAIFDFEETVRPDAAVIVRAFNAAGRPVHLLSGDRPERVRALAASIGLPETHALGGLSPQQKADWIRRHAPGPVLFLGDGANDAPAAGVAAVSGTPVADRGALTGRADFLLLHPGLGPLTGLFTVAAARHRALGTALGFALVYNLAAGATAALGLMSPLLAAVLMPAASLLSLGLVASLSRQSH